MLVNICCITFNQERFVARTIDGFLMQKTDFPFEIVIGEDCSADRTAVVVREYAEKYPSVINARYNSKNIGVIRNFRETLQQCSGKYIALCEGDDYWTDPHKLQKQIDFLERHPEYSLCAHRANKFVEETGEYIDDMQEYFTGQNDREITIHNFLDPYILNTCAVVFRNTFDFSKTPQKSFKDIFLFALVLDKGKGICLNEVMSVYRIHQGGVWSMKKELELYRSNSETMFHILKYFGNTYPSLADFSWNTLRYYLELIYREKGSKYEALKIYRKLSKCFYDRYTPWQRKNETRRLMNYLFHKRAHSHE